MMNAQNIAAANLLDIVFDGRNKAYGAYQLRRSYNKRLTTAMGSVLFVTALIFVTSMLANGVKKESSVKFKINELELIKVKEEPKPVIPPPVQEAPPARQIETVRINVPLIVPDNQVTPEDAIPTVDDVKDAQIGNVNVHGDPFDGTVIAPPENVGTGLSVAPVSKTEDYEKVWLVVENPAEFPGGIEGWKRYLERNLMYPESAIEAETQGAVRVQFIVDKEGQISEVVALNDPGQGIADEAVRIIKKGPKWKPAEQNGHKVIYRHIQTIVFQLGH
jgi:protein TonB